MIMMKGRDVDGHVAEGKSEDESPDKDNNNFVHYVGH